MRKVAVMPKVQPPELKGFMDKRLSGRMHPSGSSYGQTRMRISTRHTVVSDVFQGSLLIGCLFLQWP